MHVWDDDDDLRLVGFVRKGSEVRYALPALQCTSVVGVFVRAEAGFGDVLFSFLMFFVFVRYQLWGDFH